MPDLGLRLCGGPSALDRPTQGWVCNIDEDARAGCRRRLSLIQLHHAYSGSVGARLPHGDAWPRASYCNAAGSAQPMSLLCMHHGMDASTRRPRHAGPQRMRLPACAVAPGSLHTQAALACGCRGIGRLCVAKRCRGLDVPPSKWLASELFENLGDVPRTRSTLIPPAGSSRGPRGGPADGARPSALCSPW